MKLLSYHVTVPTEHTQVSLFPFACVHLDNAGHSKTAWQDYLHEVKSTPHGYALGLGDYHDFLRTHAREFLRLYPHDRNSFDALQSWRHDETAKFAAQLEPIKDRLIGLSLGNHHHEYPDGTNDTMELCRLLNTTYLEKGFFIRLTIGLKNRPAHSTLIVLGHHGEGVGAGSTYGGDINAMENKVKGFDFDILLLAHNHKKSGLHIPSLTIPHKGRLRLVEKQRAIIRAGCFMRGYAEKCTTYAEAKLMNPTSIGHVRLDIRFKHNQGIGEPGTRTFRHDFKVTY